MLARLIFSVSCSVGAVAYLWFSKWLAGLIFNGSWGATIGIAAVLIPGAITALTLYIIIPIYLLIKWIVCGRGLAWTEQDERLKNIQDNN